MNLDLISVSNPGLSALVNGSVQGLVLAGAVAMAMKLFPGANAATRHAVGFATLLIVAVLPMAHVRSALPKGKPSPGPSQPPIAVATPRLESVSVPTDPGYFGAKVELADEVDSGKETYRALAPATVEKPGWWEGWRRWTWRRVEWESILPNWLSVALFVGWLVGAAGKLTGLAVNYRALSRLKGRATPASEDLAARFDRLRGAMGLGRQARLGLSPVLATPIAAGFLEPAVLFPAKMAGQMEDERFEQVVCHELAHLRRRDDWTNLVQQIVKAVLFFHPGVWWLSRRLDNDREIACDDHVLAVTDGPESYALFLLTCQGGDRSSALAPAAWHRKTQIEERINMILNSSRDISTGPAPFKAGALTLSALLLAAGAFQFAPRVALAQGIDEPREEERAIKNKPETEPSSNPKRSETRTRIINANDDKPGDRSGSSATSRGRATEEHSDDHHAEVIIRRESREGAFEDRLMRLERMVESLLARSERPGGPGGPFVSEEERANRFVERGPGRPPEPPRPRPTARNKPGSGPQDPRFNLDMARHELAAQRERLQAQLEELRRQIGKVESDLQRLSRETAEREHRLEDDRPQR